MYNDDDDDDFGGICANIFCILCLSVFQSIQYSMCVWFGFDQKVKRKMVQPTKVKWIRYEKILVNIINMKIDA